MKKTMIAGSIGVTLAMAHGAATAAPPADWSKVEATEITLFYPGTSPMEWILGDVRIDRVRHGGGRAFKQGDTCADCHADETAAMGEKIVTGEKLEAKPIPGKPGSIPVTVQATHDGETLYMKFTWKQPAAANSPKLDEANPVKVAFMLDAGKVDMADGSGCWASCHGDSRTMPEASDTKTKYIKDGSLAGGVFYDLMQWRSGENKAYNGYVAEERVLNEAGDKLSAEGKLDGDTWSVVFARKFAGGEGDVTLEAGKAYNFGFAIHNEHTAGRYHHVSLGYKLGIDADGHIKATKQ
ncbi:MAG TPA: ethylbenzene dehydrogenase-related protein [Rhodocyclaceae bacterium]|nr:ethylbenzene dehydrogenase-related protein [Rhodocyclaceae bacterium]